MVGKWVVFDDQAVTAFVHECSQIICLVPLKCSMPTTMHINELKIRKISTTWGHE